ncbi:DUF5916 domain-containing protein [Luteimonas kalidii]|uniref:DUF5916 domain-containing protein n=1 Tax=Luteimonas kalidii TaxID=3042025 RepID=A0ABT6JYB6_9GAMM|nr:DUF5916 domain-containing protein [Luteimonas kalidii]MDH5835470.1 DUF5916 domain-containing protein [Luteimonas kalidii]
MRWWGCGLALLCGPAWAVEIDGTIAPGEWDAATAIDDFRMVQPLTGQPGSQPTRAWILATPDGLAVGFRNIQPPGVPRTRQKVRRDFDEQVDRVNVFVDFDGDGRTGYAFTVSSTGGIADEIITNETQFSSDWDGQWRHAVTEDAEGWSVELLIPWHTAPMRDGAGGERTLKLFLARVVGSTGERMAWPVASFERARFLSEFAPLTVTQYSQSLLAVTPYVSGLYDNVGGDSEGNAGVDLFWKPNGRFQLSATVNPDFGQVESDDLVVNFSATETFVSDKRPFFTENQGIFEYTTPSDFSQLLYTRRIGGPADDGGGASDISAALKLNGSLGAAKYGLFSADEAGEAGRSFHALRLVRDFQAQNLGMMLTHVERPFLGREASVLGIDHDWRPSARWNVRSRVFGSRIDQDGERVSDLGATVWADYEMDDGWRQQWIAMHFGNELEINDAGYLSRNSTNYLHWQVSRRFTDLPDTSRYASADWRWRASSNHNNRGQKLNDQFRMSRQGQLRDGSSEYAQINVNGAGINDLLLRGNGIVRLPANFNAYYEFERPRKGRWAHDVEAELFGGGLAGNDRLGGSLWYGATYFVSDAFSLNAGAILIQRPDWLIWQGAETGDLVGAFDGKEARLIAGLDWSIDPRQELRVKLQAIGIDARARQAWRFDPAGNAIAASDPVEDFSVRNLAFQIRYRYELAPLSYLYVVYGRGGFDRSAVSEGVDEALVDSFDLRDDEQLMVKLSYRFEL